MGMGMEMEMTYTNVHQHTHCRQRIEVLPGYVPLFLDFITPSGGWFDK